MAKKKEKGKEIDISVDGEKILKNLLKDEKGVDMLIRMRNKLLTESNQIETLHEENIERLCKMALEEDVKTGDVTTLAIVPETVQTTAFFTTREDCICCI